jgi:hypothetical protein
MPITHKADETTSGSANLGQKEAKSEKSTKEKMEHMGDEGRRSEQRGKQTKQK